ncbi:hypothetical protein FWC31_03415 [Candidatus Saccharibacteria bacterium]|nr:hypothetical protein [Candidatus Saccharibacteria bacterium]
MRDFHGVSAKAFDRQGNYTLGIVEQSIFPELTFEDTATPHGLQVTFVIKNKKGTTLDSSPLGSKTPNGPGASNVASSKALLEKFGIPFEKDAKGGK